VTSALRTLTESAQGDGRFGHAHFSERLISRGHFLRLAGGATAGALTSPLWMPALAQAAKPSAAPNPIPGGIQPFGPGTEVFHIFLPEPGNELSTITDFNGFIAAAHITGTGTGTLSGTPTPLLFDADMRFMQGEYIGVDGRHHIGTFGFF
jgi:hypothetical protein